MTFGGFGATTKDATTAKANPTLKTHRPEVPSWVRFAGAPQNPAPGWPDPALLGSSTTPGPGPSTHPHVCCRIVKESCECNEPDGI